MYVEPKLAEVTCTCGNVFVTLIEIIRKANDEGHKLSCGSCPDKKVVLPKAIRRNPNPRCVVPKSDRAKEVVSILLGLDREPTYTDFKRIGDNLGMTQQSVERLWYRWIVLPERNRLREQIKELMNNTQNPKSDILTSPR